MNEAQKPPNQASQENTRSSLIHGLKSKDDASYNRLVKGYRDYIAFVGTRHGLRTHEDIQSALQDVVQIVHKKIDGFRRTQPGNFRAWLSEITRRQTKSMLRRKAKEARLLSIEDSESLPADPTSGTHSPDLGQLDMELCTEILEAAIQRVDAKLRQKAKHFPRQVLDLHWVQHQSAKRIHQLLDGPSYIYIRVTIHRLKTRLKLEVRSILKQLARDN